MFALNLSNLAMMSLAEAVDDDVVAVSEHDNQVWRVLGQLGQLGLEQVDFEAAAGVVHVAAVPFLAHAKDLK